MPTGSYSTTITATSNNQNSSPRGNWQEEEQVSRTAFPAQRIAIVTPKGKLSAVIQSNEHTTWQTEHFLKEKSDIDLIARYMTMPVYNVDAVNGQAAAFGGQVCMIGGFDQFHFFEKCSPESTRAEVRRCFEAAGEGGGFILCPSDHFFDAQPELIHAYADEARHCAYG